MAWYDSGNAPINSTGAGFVTNPSTSALIAEIDSTQLAVVLQSAVSGAGRASAFRVTWIIGTNQSTAVAFRLEQALSTGLGSTGIRDRTFAVSGPGQSAQFVLNHKLQPGDRLRVVPDSSFAGTAYAKIQAEPLT